MRLIMISIAKVGIFFELCKSVFLIKKGKSRVTRLFIVLYDVFTILLYPHPSCKIPNTCNSIGCAIHAHKKYTMQQKQF